MKFEEWFAPVLREFYKQKLEKTMNPNNCIRPGCPNKAHSRGLCSADLNAAYRLVRQGKTTMKALEKAGKILPLKSKPRDNSWLLGETGTDSE